MVNRKYELTDETKTLGDGTVLHRIRAVRDFVTVDGALVNAGDLGGWIENESNLYHYGKAWVFENAMVYGNAQVDIDARVSGRAEVLDCALVCGRAWVLGDSRVYGHAEVCDNSYVYGHADVHGNARVCGNAEIYGNADVCGHALVSGGADVCGDAIVSDRHGYATYKNTWSSGRWFTYTRSNGMWKVGCFHGTGKELIDKAYKDSKLSGKCYERIVRAQEAIDREIHKGCRK